MVRFIPPGASDDPWLDAFRHRCDPLADEAVAEIGPVPAGTELLAAVRGRAAATTGACRRFVEATAQMPAWVRLEEHEAGRRMFLQHGLLSLFVGFTVLVETYAGSRDNKVLMMSGRIGGQASFRRLVETARFVDQVVARGGLLPDGLGTKALLSVRLLHARVRTHCRRAGYDVERYDQPINQEAMGGTLMFFSSGVIKALEMLGVVIHPEEKESYHRLWRTAGFLMGVDEALLPETYEDELALYERVKAHAFFPDDDTRTLFESSVSGVVRGAAGLPLHLQVAGAGLLRSEAFLRGFTRTCVDPRLGTFLVGPPSAAGMRAVELARRAFRARSRVHRLGGAGALLARAERALFPRVVSALLQGEEVRYENPGFAEPAAAPRS